MRRSLITLFLLFGVAFSQTVVNAQFGANTTVPAGTLTRISVFAGIFPLGMTLDIVTNVNASVSIETINTFSVNLPFGYSNNSITPGAGLGSFFGLALKVDPSTAIINCSLTTGILLGGSLKATADLSGGVIGLLYTNSTASGSVFTDIDVSFSATAGAQADLPLPGTYIFTAVSFQAQVPTYYGWVKRLVANQLRRLWFQGQVLLSVTVNSTNSVTVTKQITNPKPAPVNLYVSTGVWFNIDLTFPNASLNATISYTFDEAKWATLNASRLVIGYYDDVRSSWVFSPTTFNVSARVVSTTTTHFSTWGVYQANDTSSSSGSMSGSMTGSATSASEMMSGTASSSSRASGTVADNSSASFIGFAFVTLLAALCF